MKVGLGEHGLPPANLDLAELAGEVAVPALAGVLGRASVSGFFLGVIQNLQKVTATPVNVGYVMVIRVVEFSNLEILD